MRPQLLVTTLVFLALIFASQTSRAAEPEWKLALNGPVAATPVLLDEEIVLAAGQSLVGVRSDGSESWTIPLRGEVLSTPALTGDHIYVHTSAGLTAFSTGREALWHYAAQDLGALVDGRTWGWGNNILSDPWAYYRSAPLVTRTAVVFGTSDGVHAVNPENGERLWRQMTGPVTADIVVWEDSVLVADWSDHFRRLSLTDGAVEWTFRANVPRSAYSGWIGWIGLNLTPVIDEGHAYLGSRGTYFYAINLETGKETWSNKHGTSWIGSAAILHQGSLYFGLSDGKGLVGIEVASGNQNMFVGVPGAVFATPVVHGNYLVAGTLRGELLIVDLEARRLVVNHRLHDSPKPYNSYFQPDPDSTLTPYEFTVQQMERMKMEQQSILSLTVFGDLLLVGTGSGEVLAFNIDGLLPDH